MKPLLDSLPELRAHLPPAGLALLLDVDGTISPIAPTPDAARVDPGCKEALQALVGSLPVVAAISGRPAAQAAAMVGVEGMAYLGNHGLDAPNAETDLSVAAALERLKKGLTLPGVLMEDKGPGAAIHYRLADDPAAARSAVLNAAAVAIQGLPLRVVEGRMVVELRPTDHRANKGTAVMRLLARHAPQAALFLGDDRTDVDAFNALHAWAAAENRWGAAIAVLSEESPALLLQAADYTVASVAGVGRFLGWLADHYRA